MPRLEAPEGYSIAILHTHTNRSDGLVSPEQVVEGAFDAGAKVVAITDHDTLSGIDKAKRKAEGLGIDLVVGEEIQAKGFKHVLGLFLEKPIPHSQSVTWTMDEIKEQGGLVILPHPMSQKFNGLPSPEALSQKDIMDILESGHKFDGIEIFYNGVSPHLKNSIIDFYEGYQELLGAKIGSPDSHFGQKDIAGNYTLFPGESAKDLFKAIKEGQTTPVEGFRQKVEKIDEIKRNFKAIFILGFKRFFRLPF